MKKLSEKLRKYLSQSIPISVSTVKGEVTLGFFDNVLNYRSDPSTPSLGLPPLKVASGIVNNPVLPIIVYWERKKVYYREDLNASQIYSAFCEWMDRFDNITLDASDGPYDDNYESVPDMIVRTMEFKIGLHDIVNLTVRKVKKDWEFIEVTKEMLAGM